MAPGSQGLTTDIVVLYELDLEYEKAREVRSPFFSFRLFRGLIKRMCEDSSESQSGA